MEFSVNTCLLSIDNTASPGTEVQCWATGAYTDLVIEISGIAGGVIFDVVTDPGGTIVTTISSNGRYTFDVSDSSRICLVINTSGTGTSTIDAYLLDFQGTIVISFGSDLNTRIFEADQLESPVNADWAVNSLAPLIVDTNNIGLNVRAFDDTIEEGVGFKIFIPAGAINIIFGFVSRAEAAPPAARTVGLNLYGREIPDDAAIPAWSGGFQLTDLDFPTNENFQHDSDLRTLAALSLNANAWYQFELTRINPLAGTELAQDWDLLALRVDFS